MAAGKGVSVCTSIEEALKNTKEILEGKFKSSHQVVLEEFLEGEELSYFVIVDENSYHFFGSAQDHKRVGEGRRVQILEEWALTLLHLYLHTNWKKKLKKKL